MGSKTIFGSRLRNSIGNGKFLGRLAQGRGAMQELDISDLSLALKKAGFKGGGGGGLTSIDDGKILSNISGSSATPIGNSLTDILDYIIGNSRGSLLMRGGTDWMLLAPGADKDVLRANGTGADLSWNTISDMLDAAFGSAQGDILFRGASGWEVLAPGTTGQVLSSNGSGADINWSDLAKVPTAVFTGYPSTTTASNVTGDHTQYVIPTYTATKNEGSLFDTSTGTWTAPADGVVFYTGVFVIGGLTSSHTQGFNFAVVNGTTFYYGFINNVGATRDSSNNIVGPITNAISVSAGDTIQFGFTVSNGTKVVDLFGGAGQTAIAIMFFEGNGGGGIGGSRYFIDPTGYESASAGGGAFSFAPFLIPAGKTVKGGGFLPRATSGTAHWSVALYADLGTTSNAPGALLASTATQTGTTAGVLAQADFSSSYTASVDTLAWIALYNDTTMAVASGLGRGAAFKTGQSLPWPSLAPTGLSVKGDGAAVIHAYGP